MSSTPFDPQDGAVVAWVGDSITHGGLYHRIVADVLTLRHPGRRVCWVNCGISGDSAAGAVGRFDTDTGTYHPTHACVLFGMNDGNRGLYAGEAAAKAGHAAERARALDLHATSMAALVARLQAAGTREVVLISPTVYDQYTRLYGSGEPCGYDDALAAMGASARGLAQRTGCRFVDLHALFLKAFLAAARETERSPYVGEDRVHPLPAGHLLMAVILADAFGVSGGVGHVEFLRGECLRAEGATISDIAREEGGLAWTQLAQALGCPLPDSTLGGAPAELRAAWDRLNRDRLVVGGLPAGTYELRIDGREVLTAHATAWAGGVDLSGLSHAPQVEQAADVVRLSAEYQTYAVSRIRNPIAARMFLVWDRYAMRQKGVDIPEDELAGARRMVEIGEGNPYVLGLYRELLAHGSVSAMGEAAERLRAMQAAVWRAAAVGPRRYVLRRMGT